ncbi:transferrin receptor 1b [Trichomycterus rosablanca]|uniref:transferrin receptor 1b n=1 Tax=Trichomycterus rosablanca TaxID=2290929 RepID=UPI002F35E630
MAGPINQARAQIFKIFNGEPRSYSRFSANQINDEEDIEVEIKQSDGVEEEVVGTFTQKRQRSYQKIYALVLAFVFFFLSGYLVGYVSHRKPKVDQNAGVQNGSGSSAVSESLDDESSSTVNEAESSEPFLGWTSITNMLKEKLSTKAFDDRLSKSTTGTQDMGIDDESLATQVMDEFQRFRMNPWTDVHYVKLQVPSSEKPNKVSFGSEEIGSPRGYLAYSAPGRKQGKVVYANYGQMEDLKYLKDTKLNLTGTVALMRTGQISLAEKVANAAKFGVAAVLIYQEPASVNSELNTELYGHVHLGTGDPYTPGFPSFNHTQFPPSKSSGLPEILAQSITAETALKIHQKMGGQEAPDSFKGKLSLGRYTLGGVSDVTVTVNNVLAEAKIYNVFGVIQGFIDSDQYVVLGAQRDAFKNGFAKSMVGTSLLLELAKAITDMVKAGFRPRRSIVFASWSAGDYGSVGSTEWLEGYLASLNRRAFTYISLDGTVTGSKQFKVSASPLLHRLLEATMKEVKSPVRKEETLYQVFGGSNLAESVLEPMRMDDGAYPFLAFSGIPSISFRFTSNEAYPHYGTSLDVKEKLNLATEQRLSEFCVSAAQVAGQMALRLVHDHILNLDVSAYTKIIRKNVFIIRNLVDAVKKVQSGVSASLASSPLSYKWLIEASGSYSRAVSSLLTEIERSDLNDMGRCRNINDRIMRVEHNFLSPYVSPRETPFRHVFFGSGDYTISALLEHLKDLKEQAAGSDADLFRNQFALATWTIQSCANDLAGDVWALDNVVD